MWTSSWSLRLPRATAHLIERRAGRSVVGRVEQKRWVQRAIPRSRPPASTGERNEATVDKGRQYKRFLQRQQRQREDQQPEPQREQRQQQVGRNTQLATTLAETNCSDLVSEVHIPNDRQGVLPPDHPALSLLGNSSLVIQRQLEMMNVMLAFEQANRYIIMDGQGQTLGYIAEEDHGLGRAVVRQLARTHRSFTTHIFDAQEREVLRIHRPFAYINSRVRIYDPVPESGYLGAETSIALRGVSASSAVQQGSVAQVSPLKLEEMRIIGEAQQQWAPLRRKYNLFTYRPLEPPPNGQSPPRIESGERPASDTQALTEAKAPAQAIEAGMEQFAHVNEPFLSWDFNLRDENSNTVGSVNRNFAGFAREIFTDTGVYALRMDSAAQTSTLETADSKEVGRYERDATAMTLDQRAVMLATAISIDFDYFSRHSGAPQSGFMPIFWPMGGGAAEGGAAGAGAGAVGGAAAGEAGAAGAAGGVGGTAMEGAAAEGAAGAAGMTGRGLGTAAGAGGEGAIAGAGTMAGYEAMQRGAHGPRGGDASPQNNEPFRGDSPQSPEQSENRPGNDVWGEEQDPWGGDGPGDSTPPSAGRDSGEGGSPGWFDSLSDWFSDT